MDMRLNDFFLDKKIIILKLILTIKYSMSDVFKIVLSKSTRRLNYDYFFVHTLLTT